RPRPDRCRSDPFLGHLRLPPTRLQPCIGRYREIAALSSRLSYAQCRYFRQRNASATLCDPLCRSHHRHRVSIPSAHARVALNNMAQQTFDFELLARGGFPLQRFEPNAKIFVQDDPGACMYVVRSGKVAIMSGGAVLENVGPNGTFGEMAL